MCVVRGLGRHHPQPGAGVRERPAAGVRRPGAQFAPGGRGPTAHTVAGPGAASWPEAAAHTVAGPGGASGAGAATLRRCKEAAAADGAAKGEDGKHAVFNA